MCGSCRFFLKGVCNYDVRMRTQKTHPTSGTSDGTIKSSISSSILSNLKFHVIRICVIYGESCFLIQTLWRDAVFCNFLTNEAICEMRGIATHCTRLRRKLWLRTGCMNATKPAAYSMCADCEQLTASRHHVTDHRRNRTYAISVEVQQSRGFPHPRHLRQTSLREGIPHSIRT